MPHYSLAPPMTAPQQRILIRWFQHILTSPTFEYDKERLPQIGSTPTIFVDNHSTCVEPGIWEHNANRREIFCGRPGGRQVDLPDRLAILFCLIQYYQLGNNPDIQQAMHQGLQALSGKDRVLPHSIIEARYPAQAIAFSPDLSQARLQMGEQWYTHTGQLDKEMTDAWIKMPL